MLPSHASFEAGGYSTEAGVMEMLTRMRSGRLKVAANCIEWQEEFASYHRKDGLIVKVNDDVLSGTRVGLMALRFARPAVLGGRAAMRQQGPTMCRDIELSAEDLWG